MKWLLLAVALLVPSIAKAQVPPATCSATTDLGCFLLDYADVNDTDLVEYKDVVDAEVANAADYNALPLNVRIAIWEKIAEAYDNGSETGVLDLPNPAGMCGEIGYPTCDIYQGGLQEYIVTVYLTFAEATQMYAAKFAHALWVEVNGIVPWTLSSMTQADLELLFDPNELCTLSGYTEDWGTSVDEYCVFVSFVDHSPKRVYDVAIAAVGGPPFTGTQRQAWGALSGNFGATTRHVNATDSQHAATMTELLVDRVSRSGCHSASRYMTALSRSLNIPAEHMTGWFYSVHESAWAPTADVFLMHGDDIYTAGETRSLENSLDYWSWASSTLGYYDPDNQSKTTRRRLTRINWNTIVEGRLDGSYCAYGEDIEALMTASGIIWSSPQDDHILAAFDHELAQRTNCP